tara:strand:+ start:6706 stop:7245 length:540 start_codon:yes stop_codon:yes gene_type:complete
MSQYKFIEEALKAQAPVIIKQLRVELENQKHIASGDLYNGFKDTIQIGSNSISLLITNDTPYMWLVNDGKSGGIMASYDAILKWTYQKEGNGQLSFTSDHERANFIQTVKRNLESQYFTKSGDRNVPPYGHKRYFFIDIATHKVKKGNIFARIEKAVTKDVEGIVNKELLKKEITLTIG